MNRFKKLTEIYRPGNLIHTNFSGEIPYLYRYGIIFYIKPYTKACYEYFPLIFTQIKPRDIPPKWRLERIIDYFDGSDMLILTALEADVDGVRGNQFGGAFRPFDDGDAVGFKVFVETEVVGLFGAAEAVEVDVMKRNGSLIFTDQGIGGAADRFVDASGLREALGEAGFARAKVAVQGNHGG